jgi:hypothetical protein
MDDKELIERNDFATMLLDYIDHLVRLIQNGRCERIEPIREWMRREME